MGNQGPKLFEKRHADLFQVLVGFAWDGDAGVDRGNARDVAVETNGARLGGNLPFRGAEKDANVACVNGGDAQRDGFRLQGMVDGTEQNGVVAGDLDDGTAAGEIGDDFIFLGGGGRGSQ